MKRYIIAFVLAIAGGGAALGLERLFFSNANDAISSINGNIPATYASLSGNKLPDFTPAAEQTIHAVVHVMTKFTTTQTYFDPFQGMFGGNGMQTVPQEQQASGSGVIVSKDGYIVTNFHVIDRAEEIQVTLNDKRAYTAKVVGTDPNTDIAVLKIEEDGLPFITWGNSDNVRIGEWVLAVGNPFNLTSTVTAGIVSAKARNINIIGGSGIGNGAVEAFLQTDAAVNPGNSGGALVNTNGLLVGINTAIASQNGSFTGYSFAVPSNLVRKIVTDLIEFGMVQRGYLGVNIQDVDANLAKNLNLKKVAGVYVIGVMKNGSAEDAKLKTGDVITGIDKVAVASVAELQEQINRHRPGDKVSVTYIRKGEEEKVDATLKNRNNTTGIIKKEETLAAVQSLGATFEMLDSDELKRLGLSTGLKVSKLADGKLRKTGLKEGFIITAVDKAPVGSPQELKDILENKKGGILIEGVYPNGTTAYYALGL